MSGQSTQLSFSPGPRKQASSVYAGPRLARWGRIFFSALSSVIGDLLRGLIGAYQLLIAPLLLPSCRFEPSCSHYAQEAITEHGARRGIVLTLKRLARCHPWGGSGYDPVPPHSEH
jgi:uncharacterized protein